MIRDFSCVMTIPPNGREVAFQTTVAAQKKNNIHVHDGVSEAEFVAMRSARDATLDMPFIDFYPRYRSIYVREICRRQKPMESVI